MDAKNVLRLDVSPEDNGFLGQIGYLKEWFPGTETAIVTIPRAVPSIQIGPSISLFFVFSKLTKLEVTLASPSLAVDQHVISACAELLHLTSLRIAGGTIAAPASDKLDVGVLTSLRGLHELAIRPLSADEDEDGFQDKHCSNGFALLTNLRALDIKASEDMSDEGLRSLSSLKQLTRLSVTPIGLFVSTDGMEKFLDELPALQELGAGIRQAQQVSMLRAASHVPRVKVVSSDPDLASSAASFFSTCTLCLQSSLVSLRLCTLKAPDALFLVTIGALTALTELKMGVALREHARPFTCNLTTLRSLRSLQVLDLAVTAQIQLPITAQIITALGAAWPRLHTLSCSCMAKQETSSEALRMLGTAFSSLRSLSLFAPLDYDRGDSMERIVQSVHADVLPASLEFLVLEGASFVASSSSSSAQCPSSASATASTRPAPAICATAGALSQTASGQQAYVDGKDIISGSAAMHSVQQLGGLRHLELNDCAASDALMHSLLLTANGLTTLELSEVRGVTDVGLKALGNLARLERLVVALDSAASCSSPMVMEQRPGDMLQQLDGMGSSHGYDDLSNSSGSVTHASIESLAACGQLKHIEWSVGAGFSSYQMEHYVVPVIRKLIGLQYLCLNVKRSAAASVGASMSRSGSQGAAFLRAAVNGREGSGASASSTGGLGDGQYMYAWRAELMMALPLCQVADMASMAYYSVWDDCVIHGDE